MTSTPHLNYFKTVQYDHRILSDFIQWLNDNGIELDFERVKTYISLYGADAQKPSKLIDIYLKIDRQALEQERLQLIESFERTINESIAATKLEIIDDSVPPVKPIPPMNG